MQKLHGSTLMQSSGAPAARINRAHTRLAGWIENAYAPMLDHGARARSQWRRSRSRSRSRDVERDLPRLRSLSRPPSSCENLHVEPRVQRPLVKSKHNSPSCARLPPPLLRSRPPPSRPSGGLARAILTETFRPWISRLPQQKRVNRTPANDRHAQSVGRTVPIPGRDCIVRITVIRECNEGEASRLPCARVLRHEEVGDLSILLKDITQLAIICVRREPPDENLAAVNVYASVASERVVSSPSPMSRRRSRGRARSAAWWRSALWASRARTVPGTRPTTGRRAGTATRAAHSVEKQFEG
jgi:hypothetical protein